MKKSSRRKTLAPSLARYGLAAGAALTAGASPVSAAIISVNTPFTVDPGHTLHAWDVDGGGVTDFNIRCLNFSSSTVALRASNAAIAGNSRAWVKNPGSIFVNVKALLPGYAIGPSLGASHFGVTPPYASGGRNVAVFTYQGQLKGTLINGTQFVGFKFLVGAQTDYGWANITISTSAHSIIFNNWAYENTGATIQIPGVPEPAQAASGLALLALGAAGVAVYKRRRSATR